MSGPLRLTGYRHSVYTWSARLALTEAGAAFDVVDLDPFTAEGLAALIPLQPFGRVPVLEHGSFRLWETAAILDYVNAELAGGRMTPEAPRALARMRQVIGLVDAYGYWPLVRQVFSHGFYAGNEGDLAQVDKGLKAAEAVLDALEEIAAEGLVLRPEVICLASCHLLPMLEYFAHVPEGSAALRRRRALTRWYEAAGARDATTRTRPDLSA
ncbi:glutathione S-transferase family protein [Roseovarius sp. LXJ103]|uniref:glutathione S-transferase family protein n=1 Tax=Roseovarius carneus TaxID=2853164 RepID=UPI000D60C1FE|nr:glutathione S-transferase family protein [Roseovarius carneus]MBZ8119650.1 glutathione S-transferase family protein [Roseovarius carneus]PWE34734.1 glutathione S-transferase family protein [Pelagicola sp. LXJ1103]